MIDDFMDSVNEKKLICAPHSVTRKQMISEKEAAKMHGSVYTYQLQDLPDLPTLKDRILYVANGISQMEIAAKLGVSQKAVSYMLQKNDLYHGELVFKFAQAFGVPVTWLNGKQKQCDIQAPENTSVLAKKSPLMQFYFKDRLFGEQIRNLVFPVMDGVEYDVEIVVTLPNGH